MLGEEMTREQQLEETLKEILDIVNDSDHGLDPITIGCHCTSTDDMLVECVWCRAKKLVWTG